MHMNGYILKQTHRARLEAQMKEMSSLYTAVDLKPLCEYLVLLSLNSTSSQLNFDQPRTRAWARYSKSFHPHDAEDDWSASIRY